MRRSHRIPQRWLLLTCKKTVSNYHVVFSLAVFADYKTVCAPGGYMEFQGYDISATRALIPKLQELLNSFRSAGFPVYHTREGKTIT